MNAVLEHTPIMCCVGFFPLRLFTPSVLHKSLQSVCVLLPCLSLSFLFPSVSFIIVKSLGVVLYPPTRGALRGAQMGTSALLSLTGSCVPLLHLRPQSLPSEMQPAQK